ncbi:TPA: glyoxalase/bleomycin resistance/dioxygenase family protein [Legionella pneumophila]|uniref:VOC family protein n=1 Tax=Legionella pneumophila TaxID=446 RepID=UPI000777751C|nr:VOC family protein [Legionella pneumophila]HAT8648935.1 glyoxalase/bleomycin resistance/dioxygenase family protein [Legionella pneumophila]
MSITFGHVNIIATDWRRLASFYIDVFACTEVPPQRNQSGKWLEEGTGVANAHLQGVHLRLPGHGEKGPTLEIYSYSHMEEKLPAVANRKGFGHIAFSVEDVSAIVEKVLAHGGSLLGKITHHDVPGVGQITFVYCMDPEDNIIEIQSWSKLQRR